MLLSQRSAKIGNAINTRAEMHGEESLTAVDIPLTDIMLDANELNALLREPYAHRALFDQRRGVLCEPLFKHLKPLALADKIEGACISITHGVAAEVLTLAAVKLAKIKLEPRVGGLTAMSCTVQALPELNADMAHLLERLNAQVEVAIDGGEWGAQAELPLNQAGEDEALLNASASDVGAALAREEAWPAEPTPRARRGKANGQRERVQ
jgi:hypothetical protein